MNKYVRVKKSLNPPRGDHVNRLVSLYNTNQSFVSSVGDSSYFSKTKTVKCLLTERTWRWWKKYQLKKFVSHKSKVSHIYENSAPPSNIKRTLQQVETTLWGRLWSGAKNDQRDDGEHYSDTFVNDSDVLGADIFDTSPSFCLGKCTNQRRMSML